MSKCLEPYNSGHSVVYCQRESGHDPPCGPAENSTAPRSDRPRTVHILRGGRAVCEFTADVPGDWPSSHVGISMREWVDGRDDGLWSKLRDHDARRASDPDGDEPCPECDARARTYLSAACGEIVEIPPAYAMTQSTIEAVRRHEEIVAERWTKFDQALEEVRETLRQVEAQVKIARAADGGLSTLKRTVKALAADATWLMERTRELRR